MVLQKPHFSPNISQSIRPKAPKRVNQCAFSGARRGRLEQEPPSEAAASAAVGSAAAVGAERLASMACWDPEVTYGDLFLQNGDRENQGKMMEPWIFYQGKHRKTINNVNMIHQLELFTQNFSCSVENSRIKMDLNESTDPR